MSASDQLYSGNVSCAVEALLLHERALRENASQVGGSARARLTERATLVARLRAEMEPALIARFEAEGGYAAVIAKALKARRWEDLAV